MEYKLRTERHRKQQSFDKDNIFIKRGSKMINMYQMIQEGREDTEIEPTLKKYGCLEGNIAVDNKKMLADFSEMQDFRGINDMAIKAKEMFYDLPLATRQKFNNDINTFTKEGKAYVQKLVDKDIADAKARADNEKKAQAQVEANNKAWQEREEKINKLLEGVK